MDFRPHTVLSEEEWKARAAVHFERARAHTEPARHRADRAQPHPLADFLFTYYPFPFSLLEHWHPEFGMGMEWKRDTAPPPFRGRVYRLEAGVLAADPGALSAKEIQRLVWTKELLDGTAERAPNFACHGLHEWAMVYGGREIRHERTLALRLTQEEIDVVVESRTIRCSHHDAFRFFAPRARCLNQLQPDIDSRHLMEQPACLHANMDLYKWAAKAMPWVGSELLLECFELAVELRDLDMRASPYDLQPWGREPVRIETAEGRKQYEAEQRRLAERAMPLRKRLAGQVAALLDAAAFSRQTPCQPSF